ncbi:efflux RND transporter periplasmic adaptor subunit [Chelatococcus sambhunathii]|uniref:Efflux RND transporter periplasmic adaptor subunit n=1 Tax=Chelatococcus sambhunathii TaxID=363953 RepID=A0ABU1DI03_9HYPH|nr:efflux RND transporter periplasmic adaptor subunit [Chelatococcus sambhunathii]MDR4307741.1 efflux RND transporter periplasmic adaptor subunit [Chelatococcus sambhunathii]
MAGRVYLALALALAAGAGFGVYRMQWAADAAAPAEKPKPRIPVTVAEARQIDVPVTLSGLGVVQPLNVVTVRSRVDGAVTEVAYEEGRLVKQGDLLVQIDARPYKAALDQAKAKQQQDEATLANAERDLARSQALAQNAYASRQTVDQQRATVAQLKAQIEGDKAAVESAQVQLDYATIRAPITGRTGFRLVDKGNLVRSSDATGIVTISQLDPINAVFTLPERDFSDVSAALKRGEVQAVALAPDGRELATGKLSVLNSLIDQATGTFRAKAEFPNADGVLWPGQSVTVRVRTDTLTQVVTAPEDAVQRGPQGAYAFVVGADGAAERRRIVVARQADGLAVVGEGLRAGERVVTGGASRVSDGARLDVSDARSADAKPAGESAAP